jgi:transposase
VALLLLRPGDRTTAERQTVEQVKGLHQEVRQAVRQAVLLLAGFARLLRASPHEQPDHPLGRWIGEVAGAGLPEFDAVVTTIRQDLAAVLAALRLPWSQGQTEGQITKLTLLKRSMDGRSGCDLLTPRVLYASAAF